MNLGAARIVLRRRTQAESFDLALAWCTGPSRGLLLRLGAVVLLPAIAGCAALRWGLAWKWLDVWMVAIAIATVVQGLFTIAVGRSLFAADIRARDVLGAWLRRLPSYLGALLVTRVLLAIAMVLLFPLVWMWPRMAFVHEASLLELHGPWAARRRAVEIVRGDFGEALVMLLVAGLALVFAIHLGDVIGVVVLDVLLQLGRPFGDLYEDGGSLAALVGFFAAIPYVATARFLRYIDTRTRRDGWDLQLGLLARARAAAEDRT